MSAKLAAIYHILYLDPSLALPPATRHGSARRKSNRVRHHNFKKWPQIRYRYKKLLMKLTIAIRPEKRSSHVTSLSTNFHFFFIISRFAFLAIQQRKGIRNFGNFLRRLTVSSNFPGKRQLKTDTTSTVTSSWLTNL